MAIQIVGFSTTNKVPGFFGETVLGAGAITAGSLPLTLLVSGTKGSTGTAVANQDVDDILSSNDADTKYGAGFEITRMLYQALLEPGVKLKGAPSAEAGGAVAGALTITITGPATTSGDWAYRIDGKRITRSHGPTDSATTIAAAIVAAVNADTTLSVTAGNAAGVVTLTKKSKGARGNNGIVFQDTTKLGTGVTSTLGGGGVAVTGGGLHFATGSGTETVTTLLSVLFPDTYDRVAFAQNDSTAAVAWRDHFDTKAGVLEGRLQHGVCGQIDSLATAITLAQTNLNANRVQVLWLLNGETVPSEMAARFAAKRTATEQADPDSAYDGQVLTGIAPQSQRADWSSTSTLVSALDNGVTPLATNPDGTVYVVRSIVSHSLNGSLPDYRTLDTSDAVVPDYARTVAKLIWLTEYLPANKRVADNPPAGAKDRPAGVATPDRWNQRLKKMLTDLNDALICVYSSPDASVELNQPVSEYNKDAKRIMTLLPVVPFPNQHQIGVSVRGLAA